MPGTAWDTQDKEDPASQSLIHSASRETKNLFPQVQMQDSSLSSRERAHSFSPKIKAKYVYYSRLSKESCKNKIKSKTATKNMSFLPKH